MNPLKRDQTVNEMHGELTRILLQYWEIMGRPDLAEFMALIPIEPALRYIERSRIDEARSNHETNVH